MDIFAILEQLLNGQTVAPIDQSTQDFVSMLMGLQSGIRPVLSDARQPMENRSVGNLAQNPIAPIRNPMNNQMPELSRDTNIIQSLIPVPERKHLAGGKFPLLGF